MPRPELLTVEDVRRVPDEAAKWLRASPDWVWKRRHTLPGMIRESGKKYLFHPATYIEVRLKRKGCTK